MGLKSYFDKDLRTTLAYMVISAIMGYVSLVINHTAYATLAALLVLAMVTLVMKRVLKIKEDFKWWLGNGIIIYLFVWLIVWTILYNTYVI